MWGALPGEREALTRNEVGVEVEVTLRLTVSQYVLVSSTLGSWPSPYSIGTDRTENTTSNISSVIKCLSVAVIT
jgi:hypothetical protein